MEGVCSIMLHFACFSKKVHSGKNILNRKSCFVQNYQACTEIWTYENADLSDIIGRDNHYFPIVDRFTSLGSVVTQDCKDENGVNTRIETAGITFGSLRKCLFSSTQISFKVKGEVSIPPILLCRSLTEYLLISVKLFILGHFFYRGWHQSHVIYGLQPRDHDDVILWERAKSSLTPDCEECQECLQ